MDFEHTLPNGVTPFIMPLIDDENPIIVHDFIGFLDA